MRDILEAQEENVQLRAALGGMMQVGAQRLGGEYAPWLNQMVEDILWYVEATARLGRSSDEARCREGRRLLLGWTDASCRWKILDRSKMRCFLMLTTYPEDFKDREDPVYTRVDRGEQEGERSCEIQMDDGTQYGFVGKPADLGVHRYYIHNSHEFELCNT